MGSIWIVMESDRYSERDIIDSIWSDEVSANARLAAIKRYAGSGSGFWVEEHPLDPDSFRPTTETAQHRNNDIE